MKKLFPVSVALLALCIGLMFQPIHVKASSKQWTGLNWAQGVAIGDYDNDHLNEIAYTEGSAGLATIFRSDGTTIAKQWSGLNNPYGLAIGDFDNDALNEIAITEKNGGKVTVYESDGVTVAKQWTGLQGPEGVAIGDFDNDGLKEIGSSRAKCAQAFYLT